MVYFMGDQGKYMRDCGKYMRGCGRGEEMILGGVLRIIFFIVWCIAFIVDLLSNNILYNNTLFIV